MLEKAVRICDARFGNIYLREDSKLHLVAAHNVPDFLKTVEVRRSTRLLAVGLAAGEIQPTVHVVDLATKNHMFGATRHTSPEWSWAMLGRF